jgi:excinuclease ABC subunit A
LGNNILATPLIRVRGARTHNLQNVDLDLPCGKLIAVCGISGSGKSSLAVDTLYAEGQRRFVETFSPHARQFLERLPRPEVDEIEGLPPPVRVQEPGPSPGRRLTVGTVTEIYDILRLLFGRFGEVVCPDCRRVVRRDRIEDVTAALGGLAEGTRLLIAFPADRNGTVELAGLQEELQGLGFRRVITGGELVEIESRPELLATGGEPLEIVVDRLVAKRAELSRIAESLEAASDQGGGRYVVYVEAAADLSQFERFFPRPAVLDGRPFARFALGTELECHGCGATFIEPEPQLFNLFSPVGACPRCEGLGAIVQGGSRSAGQGKIWRTCPACGGRRLRPEALAVQLAGKSIAEVAALPAAGVAEFAASLDHETSRAADPLLAQLAQRLAGLRDLAIGHLPIDRTVRVLSRGERQRVVLAHALSSSLVNGLYILDEPMTGLHPADIPLVVAALGTLRGRGNTVLVVEHERAAILAADFLVEMGPGAGHEGGKIVFHGTPEEIRAHRGTATADWLSGSRASATYAHRRTPEQGWIRLVGGRAKNLQDVTVEFPLGVLCVVTGVSGAGKSALVQETLYPALRAELDGKPRGGRTWSEIHGAGQIEHVELVDQSPPARTARASPVTYVKAFDAIRRVFAETIDATTHNYGPGFFSFNVEGGRCETCKGEGRLVVDMQFLPDLHMVCPECNGRRYRPAALAVLYRGRSIADVLQMTVREAIGFFRGQVAVQTRLSCLKDAGLDYLRLGQPIHTLSGGESQRLKLAAVLQGKRSGRTLFLLDEPTAGLHATDVAALLDCLDGLVSVGHSLVAVTHHLQLIRSSDYVIDIGPGAGDEGGRVVARGTPEQIASVAESVTGRCL